ncbi:MAG: hypothetical protein MSS69_01475 [Spirochaetales bacterium]|nr:hypothetical protein [Spirochaetales bacterium]
MTHTIENEGYRITIEERGAELLSFKRLKDEREYIWNGEETIWKWHAPVLFPQCGNFSNGYTYKGKTLHLPMHGFLRDVIHSYNGDGVFSFSFDGCDDYPFSFQAITYYILTGNKLNHRIEITNTGVDPMPYSLGFHTGLWLKSPLLTFEREEDEIGSKEFKCNDDTMKETKLYTSIKSRKVFAEDEDGKKLSLSYSDFSTLVLWSPQGHSDKLVCIEPRIDTVPEGAKEPFSRILSKNGKVMLEETIEVLN